MDIGMKWRLATTKELEIFLHTDKSTERVKVLDSWKSSKIGLPASVVQRLLELQAPESEIISGFEACIPSDKPSFELWVTGEFLKWNQNIAAASLRAWARTTDGILWHRLLPILAAPELPQRIRYTILEIAPLCHGYEITQATLNNCSWENLSPAFQALVFERSLQFDINSERLTTQAKIVFKNSSAGSHLDQKALIPAYTYLMRYNDKEMSKIILSLPHTIWTDLIKVTFEAHNRRKTAISRLEKMIAKKDAKLSIAAELPPLWSRAEISKEIVTGLLNSCELRFNDLAGIPRGEIIAGIKQSTCKGPSAKMVITHVPLETVPLDCVSHESDFSRSYETTMFPLLAAARIKACSGKLAITADQISSTDQFIKKTYESADLEHPHTDLIEPSKHNELPPTNDDNNIWRTLEFAQKEPEGMDLHKLSTECRKYKGLVHLAFIKVMSKMPNRDDAVLKLLDYIRSDDESILRAVVHALSSINSPRSHLELIAMLTRPNSTLVVQQDIVAALARKDLSSLQKELRSAIQDLKTPPNVDNPMIQIKDELSALLSTTSTSMEIHEPQNSTNVPIIDNLNLDHELSGMIPNYKVLSSEVKRALRTALFFNKTATNSSHASSIDLSPVIDMQYKAMELLYREFFEDMVSQSLQSGSIQRKLDIIGYARPIVRQMDEFEAYISSLPIIRDIPFFSKFKLRKMLRAMCQFEPGRRFTLDGLKAFGLYFFIFGRQNCRAGLAGIINLGASDDGELAELCKELHVFQDFRNRAAHEGFHPNASNDIHGIWRTSASVVQWAFKIKNAQKTDIISAEKKAS
jgi:hypothetical protein